MGLIGYFGQDRFEVSSTSVFTPNNDLQRATAGRFEKFNRIGGKLKPLTEFIGPDLDTVTFSVTVNATLGVNPRKILDHWTQLASAGKSDVLVIGNKALGTDQWIVKSATEAWKTLDGQGNVLESTITLVFEEFMTQ